jgi:hypothetical protein
MAPQDIEIPRNGLGIGRLAIPGRRIDQIKGAGREPEALNSHAQGPLLELAFPSTTASVS